MDREFDVIILGQGLAGTALAWTYLRWNRHVIVIDREQPETASRIAAGLITPITGQKFVRTWRLLECWPEAVAFYRDVEQRTDDSFFRTPAMVRIFDSPLELDRYSLRYRAEEFDGWVSAVTPQFDPTVFDEGYGSFEMKTAGQLDTNRYLDASRNYFATQQRFLCASLDLENDIQLSADRVAIPRLGIAAQRLVFCQGIDACENPWFRDVKFKPAKGEILTLSLPELDEPRVFHRKGWLARTATGTYRAGATYDWNDLSPQPTVTGRQKLVSQLSELLKTPFEVIAHQAAIRPIHRNQYPVIGVHPQIKTLAMFNGLGSKGALYAPSCASQLVRYLEQNVAPDPALDLRRKT